MTKVACDPPPAFFASLMVSLFVAAACSRGDPQESGEPPAVGGDVSAHLEALGYISHDPATDRAIEGVTISNATALAPGINLWTNDVNRIRLTDVAGKTLREIEVGPYSHCEHVELLSDGGLAVVCEKEALVVVSRDGVPTALFKGAVHHDLAEVSDGSCWSSRATRHVS